MLETSCLQIENVMQVMQVIRHTNPLPGGGRGGFLTLKRKVFMRCIPVININDYNYDLPDERIAKHPAEKRDGSKLLIYNKGSLSEDRFNNIIEYLPKGSLLVFNDTMVIRARLLFTKETGAAIEVFCLEPLQPAEYQQSFSTTGKVVWKCIVGNLKKWKSGQLVSKFVHNGIEYRLKAEKLEPLGEAWQIKFTWEPGDLTFGEVTECAGHIPLPPYLGRDDEEEDYDRYQTVYASVKGSVAAPTAGLHFTDDILEKIKKSGRNTEKITLHVGAGTFKPVKSSEIAAHEMHCEHYFIKSSTIENLIRNSGKIIAVGTTSVRCLESLYWTGIRIISGNNQQVNFETSQWEYAGFDKDVSMADAFEAILSFMKKNRLDQINASTRIMILPGYRFRVVNGIITNFHQPKSTLLLLISAWCGDKWKDIYNYALEHEFRFLSYGDSSILL
jgi:S-adenosylmethionine:tRNA ribosyltransferase-isomerase